MQYWQSNESISVEIYSFLFSLLVPREILNCFPKFEHVVHASQGKECIRSQ